MSKRHESWNRYNRKPVARYAVQKARAAERGILFLLTLDEWLEIWGDKLPKRGRCSECLVMARTGDTGPYAVGNVSIKTNAENMNERKRLRGSEVGNSKLSEDDIPRIRDMLRIGVAQRKIAQWFGVTQKIITLIGQGRIWSHA